MSNTVGQFRKRTISKDQILAACDVSSSNLPGICADYGIKFHSMKVVGDDLVIYFEVPYADVVDIDNAPEMNSYGSVMSRLVARMGYYDKETEPMTIDQAFQEIHAMEHDEWNRGFYKAFSTVFGEKVAYDRLEPICKIKTLADQYIAMVALTKELAEEMKRNVD